MANIKNITFSNEADWITFEDSIFSSDLSLNFPQDVAETSEGPLLSSEEQTITTTQDKATTNEGPTVTGSFASNVESEDSVLQEKNMEGDNSLQTQQEDSVLDSEDFSVTAQDLTSTSEDTKASEGELLEPGPLSLNYEQTLTEVGLATPIYVFQNLGRLATCIDNAPGGAPTHYQHSVNLDGTDLSIVTS